jgi:hypothetical protein
MFSSLFLASAFVLPVVLSQTTYNDLGCSHYSSYPADTCFNSGYTAYMYTCNVTGQTITDEYWSSTDSCEGDATYSYTYDISNSLVSECDDAGSCDYFSFYCDESGSVYGYATVITDICLSGTMYTCSGNTLTTTTYTDANCTEGASDVVADYSTYADLYDCTSTCGGGSGAAQISVLSVAAIVASTLVAKIL